MQEIEFVCALCLLLTTFIVFSVVNPQLPAFTSQVAPVSEKSKPGQKNCTLVECNSRTINFNLEVSYKLQK